MKFLLYIEQVNEIIIPPDYSSDNLVLQVEITGINARLNEIDEIDITGLQDRVKALESQVAINTQGIADIQTDYAF
jgi:hypothetical protein